MEILYVILGLGALLVVGGIVIYNRLVALRQNRNNAFSDIEVQLKQRFDLIPNLVETVKGYASHEQAVFENVTEARAGVSKASGTNERLAAEKTLGAAMMNLFAVAENYPDLKADTNFQQLMAEVSDIENKISAARRFFNNAVQEYNTAIQQIPGNLVAPLGSFGPKEYFEIPEGSRGQIEAAPEVKF